MFADLPSDDVLYEALLKRDSQYDGRAFVAVRTTGIFCRLTCPARKPKRENCSFHASISACVDAGFRPCQRCRPLAVAGNLDSPVKELIEALEQQPGALWNETALVDRGFDPSTVRRAFKRHFGITFLAMARAYRIRSGVTSLTAGNGVIEAQLTAGFNSASGFREAVAKLLGCSPQQLTQPSDLLADWIDTPIGPLLAIADADALHLLEFFDRRALPTELGKLQARFGGIMLGSNSILTRLRDEITQYFGGQTDTFATPLHEHGSDFTRQVWHKLVKIPCGQTRSYGQLAEALAQPGASRAVARANGANQIAILIPCHRVIGADGTLTGYGGGLWRKQWLLDHERTMATKKSKATADGLT